MRIDEVYKRTLLGNECPRRGDLAAIVKDHHKTETGALVRVVNDPHKDSQRCFECGQLVTGYFVEVESNLWPHAAGPYFYPIGWLRRVIKL